MNDKELMSDRLREVKQMNDKELMSDRLSIRRKMCEDIKRLFGWDITWKTTVGTSEDGGTND